MYAESIDTPPNDPVRFRGLGTQVVHGFTVKVTEARSHARILALRGLSRENCPEGLLIKNVNRSHTFGNRFKVDMLFLGENYEPLIAVREVEPGHRVRVPEATHVLLLPSDWDIEKWDAAVTRREN